MKILILPCAWLIITIASCKKNKEIKSDESNKPYCQINIITPSTGIPTNFYYNGDAKIEAILSGINTTNIVYDGNSMIATETANNNLYYQKRTYNMNSNGLPNSLKIETNPSGNDWILNTYEYNGTELKKLTVTTSVSSVPLIVNYYWSNGNLDSTTDGNNIHKYEYYTNMDFGYGDASQLTAMLSTDGVLLVRTKSKRKTDIFSSTSLSYSIHYEYLFDNAGKVTEMTENNLTYKLQYQCK